MRRWSGLLSPHLLISQCKIPDQLVVRVTLLLIWKPILWRFRMILTFGVECESNFSCWNTTAFCDALVKFSCTLAALGHIHFEHGIMVHLFLIFCLNYHFSFPLKFTYMLQKSLQLLTKQQTTEYAYTFFHHLFVWMK